MKVDQIIRQNYAAGTTAQKTIGRGHLNGLLLMASGSIAGLTVTVKRRMNNGKVHVLASALTVGTLGRISDLEFGYSSTTGKAIQGIYTALIAKAGAVAGTPAGATGYFAAADLTSFETSYGELGLTIAFLDLGSLYLGNEGELDVSVAMGSAVGTGMLAVYTVSRLREPDKMFQYDLSFDWEATQKRVDSVYYGGLGGSGILATDDTTFLATAESSVVMQYDDGEGTVICDVLGMYLATVVFSRAEAIVDQVFVKVYQRTDVVPRDVYLKVTGYDAANHFILIKRVLYDNEVLSAHTVIEGKNLAARIAELEASDPATAQALRHAGAIVRADAVRAAVSAVTSG